MDAGAALVILVFVFGFGLISRGLDTLGLSAPLVFVAFGALIGEGGLGLLSLDEGLVDVLAELTLMLILFGDAARIDLRALRRESGLPLRLLGIGMPLTILLGAALAKLCFPGLSLWEAGLLGAVLAPTDAALGQAVVSIKAVPTAIRQALNVESGLNDGIALPIVMVLAALAATGPAAGAGSKWGLFTLAQVTLGPLTGLVVALAGGALAELACRRGVTSETFERIAGLSLALLSYFVAQAVGGNGFIAAFVGGLVLGNRSPAFAAAVHGFLETEGQLLMIAVFTLVGALWAVEVVAEATPVIWAYAIASLTLVRMLPVGLSLLGAELRWPTVLFLGWFGPRGLATVLFALLVVEREELGPKEQLFEVALLTVVLSVVAHGLSARPLARRYGAWAAELDRERSEHEEVVEHPTRVDHRRPRGPVSEGGA